jgi:arylsulfatase A-like enzyme
VDFIEAFLRKHREEPFFIYYPMALPHGPFVPTPLSGEWEDPELRLKSDKRYFADMVEYMDFLMGRILNLITDLGLEQNTLVLFYSDNGTHQSIISEMNGQQIPGGKALTTQTGIRVPLIAWWPGTIMPGTTDVLVDASDFLPTLAELSGTAIPDNWHTDGISFTGTLLGDQAQEREAAFFWYDPRPGWDKDRYRLEIFALDHEYKVYSDGRMYDIRGLLPVETELDTSNLSEDASQTKKKLQELIMNTL